MLIIEAGPQSLPIPKESLDISLIGVLPPYTSTVIKLIPLPHILTLVSPVKLPPNIIVSPTLLNPLSAYISVIVPPLPDGASPFFNSPVVSSIYTTLLVVPCDK